MLLRIATATLLAISSMLPAQQSSSSGTEPEYRDQVIVFLNGQPMPLEHATAVTDTKSRRNFVITPNMKVFESIPKPSSPIRVPPTAHFIVKLATAGRDPATLIHLRPLTATKKDRQILVVTYKQSLIPFGGVKHDRAEDDSVAVSVKKYGTESLEIVPASPLPAGEYAFMFGHEAQCFGVDANLTDSSTTPASGNSRRAAMSAPVVPPVWTFKKLPPNNGNGTEALLPGVVEGKGIRAPAVLSVACNSNHFDSGIVFNPAVRLRLRKELIGFDAGEISMEAGMQNDYGRSQLGNQPQIHIDIDGSDVDEASAASLGIGIDWQDLKAVVDAPGTSWTLAVQPTKLTNPVLTAHFQLPMDNAALEAMMTPCFDYSDRADADARKLWVFSCPVQEGKVLRDGAVVYAASGRALPMPDGMNSGAEWILPKKTKAHPVAPKLLLACAYGPAGYVSEQTSPSEKKTFPIPATASSCTFVHDSTETRVYAACSAAAPVSRPHPAGK